MTPTPSLQGDEMKICHIYIETSVAAIIPLAVLYEGTIHMAPSQGWKC